MTRYDFYNNLELFHKTKEIIQQEEQEKIQEDLSELKHYGTLGQKWGVRKWQNYDGTFNEAGKERYFGKSSGSSSTDEEKVGSVKSDVKSYLKFRNKMLRQRTDRDLKNKYLEEIKDSDKQLLKDAKKVDKQREKMYKNQLKEHYDDPNELVRDLDMMYKIGSNEQKVGGLFNKKAINENGQEYNPKYQNRDGSLTWEGRQLSEKKAAKKINSEMLEDYKNKKSEREEQERIEQEAKENKVKELLNNARSDVKIKKELQNKDISDKELENIINDIDNYSSWKYWDELEKNNKNEFNKIADLGLDALDRSSKYYSSDDDIGDDGWRDWFMYEDQTIGLPQITKLYYDGYSKDYINKMIDKVSSISYEDYEKKYGEDSSAKFFIDQTDWQKENKKFVEALFDPDYNAKDQKIGGLFNKTSEEKAEKKATKEGKKLNEKLEKGDYAERVNIYENIINDEKYKKLFDEIDTNDTKKNEKNLERVKEIFNDYNENEYKHLATAGIMNMLHNGYYKNPNMEDLSNNAWSYIYEDGNQGYNTAEYLYSTIDKGIKAEEINNLYKDLHNHANTKDNALAILKSDPVLSNIDEKYLNRIINKKMDKKYNNVSEYWNLWSANSGNEEPNAKQKKDYKEAKDIVKKLDSSCGNSDGWDFLNQAIQNLDMSSKELSSMTQTDWDRINAEINKLKK